MLVLRSRFKVLYLVSEAFPVGLVSVSDWTDDGVFDEDWPRLSQYCNDL